MNNELLAAIESLSESLVLSDGTDGLILSEKFAGLSSAAAALGQTGCADAAQRAALQARGSAGDGKSFSRDYLDQVVSAFQDVFINGRNAQEIELFRHGENASPGSNPENPALPGSSPAGRSGSPIFDRKILSDFLSRQDGVMEDFEAGILDLEKKRDPQIVHILLRALHTLKGESALLGMADVEQLCHALESYFSQVGGEAKIDLLLEAKDWFLQTFRYHSNRGVAPISSESLCRRLSEPNASAEPAPAAEVAAPSAGTVATTHDDAIPLLSWIEIPPGTDPVILGDFIVESKEHLEAADLSIMALENNTADHESMNSIFRGFHSIKGVASFLEMKGIRTMAHEVETLLDNVRSGITAVSGPIIDILLESVDALRKMIFALQNPADPGVDQAQADAWNALLARVRAARATAQNPSDAAEAPPNTTRVEAASQNHSHQVKAETGATATSAGKNPDWMPAAVPKLGEILVQSGAVSPELMQATLAVQKALETPEKLGELLVAEGAASAQTITQALRSQKPGEEGAAPVVAVKETVKVEADRLDRLLDSIGELVIAESMIVQSSELKGKVSPLMAQRLAHLDKITRGLQQMGTSLRMVPIRPVFQKMSRLVRDLSKKHHKSIEFITSGDETELDKTVVEKIGDPLVHMVRNAIDHGIESDANLRVSGGKSATATVTLTAFQKGGNICIKLEDDGRGLNREAILAKAIERGLIKPDAALEDRDVWQLIFEPGFSTAKEVTETSGRGVGMDVVKRNVQELRGRIDIVSQPGQGTSFSIWLPLTLAIIDGMIVRLGKERFIFPTLSILRIVPLVKEEIHTVVDKGEMLKLQDEMVPLLRLNQIYPGFNSSGWSRLAVIVESDGRKIGIPVDELLGQQQIVIKGLGESFKNIAGLTGGAILSDGMVGMILDVDGLMKYLYAEEVRA